MTAEQIRTKYTENLASIAVLHKEQAALVQQLRELGFAFVDVDSTAASHEFLNDGLLRFAEAIAELERQRCAALCKQADRYRGGYFAELVLRHD